jgi:hypothetical protein
LEHSVSFVQQENLMEVRFTFATVVSLAIAAMGSACGAGADPPKTPPDSEPANVVISTVEPTPSVSPPRTPSLQSEIIEEGRKTSDFPIGNFDFKNFKYPLPRGWQDSDGKEAELTTGKRPVTMTDEVARIGLSHITTTYFDANGDGNDEAVVILKIETGGSAFPHLVYIFQWKNGGPELIWNFRTGDRADGGLKSIKTDNGEVVVELFGQDRYIVGELDTAKITGDEEQICCPTHWTRSRYKWNGNNFRIQGKRLTFLTADVNAAPVENMIEAVEKQKSGKK